MTHPCATPYPMRALGFNEEALPPRLFGDVFSRSKTLDIPTIASRQRICTAGYILSKKSCITNLIIKPSLEIIYG